MPKPNLRAIVPSVDHPRDRARREVKRWRSNAEKEKLPIANQFHSGAANLFVNEVLKGTLREMPEVEDRKPFPWIAVVAFVGGLLGIAKLLGWF